MNTPFPTVPSDQAIVEGYLTEGQGYLRLHASPPQGWSITNDCIQLLRPSSVQFEPLPTGRAKVTGRLGIFDGLELIKLQMGSDHATHEVCDARYLIVQNITSAGQ